jgi:deoxyribodipyrimidine photo-lyase
MSGGQRFETALWWTRRDLRLADNQALSAALADADRVIPVFVLDPELLDADWAGANRVGFVLGGLRELDRDLRARDSYLVVRRGDPLEELTTLLAETGASGLYAEEDVWPYGARRDARIAEALPLHLTGGLTVHPSDAVLKADGTPYTVYTPYSRRWLALPLPTRKTLLPAPERIPTPIGIASLPIPDAPTLPDTAPFPPGESEAQRRLTAFCQASVPPAGQGLSPGIYAYAEARDRMDLDATSRLSPYLRFGMLSARRAVVAAHEARERAGNPEARDGAETWLNELIWREFYQQILHHYPHVLEESFRENLRAVAWENDKGAYAAWCAGRAGYPIVDAAMRQLTTTGWMHNRARMVAASFLTKDLLIDWRWGEQFFMQYLLDADHAANNGGWQWTAGTGTDAAPYFRIFNPVLQGKRHDPQGDYVRRWVPELARVPQRYVHTPWEMPSEVQREAGCLIGQDYPAPIVDHGWARERTLAAYGQARSERP